MSYDISERDRLILEAVIQDYIRTAEPVGSRTLSRRYNLKLSPATIRNVMADLEELGFLSQPHTSAGRIPTEQGLRFYVDTILEVRNLSGSEQRKIDREFTGITPEVEQTMKKTSRVLSSVSRHIGVVLAPTFSRAALKQIQFVRLSDHSILVILVGVSGLIQNRIIEVDESFNQDKLDHYNNYLNDILEGLTIDEIKKKIVEEMRNEKNAFDRMYSQALALTQKVFESESDEGTLYVQGQANLLNYPEFTGVESMKNLFRTFEEKSILVELLDKTLSASGVQIFIGSENTATEMQGFTLITSRYTKDTKPLGTLGVIGPTRLNYRKIIPVVDYTAKLVSHIFESTL